MPYEVPNDVIMYNHRLNTVVLCRSNIYRLFVVAYMNPTTLHPAYIDSLSFGFYSMANHREQLGLRPWTKLDTQLSLALKHIHELAVTCVYRLAIACIATLLTGTTVMSANLLKYDMMNWMIDKLPCSNWGRRQIECPCCARPHSIVPLN